jgi:ADP-ribose pyrophosphatase
MTPSPRPPVPLSEVPAPVWPGRSADGEIEVLEEVLVWRNQIVRLYEDRVRYPAHDGGKETDGRNFRLVPSEDQEDGVVMAPIDEQGRLLLVRQFRHPVRRWLVECPRGGRDAGESPEEGAARELREEIGATASAFLPLGRLAPDSGQLGTVVWLLAARVRRDGPRQPEDTEAIDRVVPMTYAALRSACERGEILDAFTLAVVLRLAPYVQGDALALPWPTG